MAEAPRMIFTTQDRIPWLSSMSQTSLQTEEVFSVKEYTHTHKRERGRERERERNAYRRPTLIVYELSILKKDYECPALEQLLTLTPIVIHIKIIGTTCAKIRFLNILLFHLFLMLKVKLLLAKLVIFFKNVLSSRDLLFLNSDMETLEQSGKSVQS